MSDYRYNERIRISPVFLIDHNGTSHGSVPTAEALKLAREAGLDLVEVAPAARPPVCKILDYGKFKYQQSKKDDKARSHSKAGQLKEVKIKTVRIGDHDLMIKSNHAMEFLKEGNKVQFTLQFRGREIAHAQLGYALFRKIKEHLASCSKVEMEPKLMGKRMSMVLMPDNRGTLPGTKPGDKAAGPGKPAVSGVGLNLPTPGGAPRPAPAVPSAPTTPAAPRPVAPPAPALAEAKA